MKNPFARGFSSSYLGNWFAFFEFGVATTVAAAAEATVVVAHLSPGPSLYGGGGLSPASGTVVSFNEQLNRSRVHATKQRNMKIRTEIARRRAFRNCTLFVRFAKMVRNTIVPPVNPAHEHAPLRNTTSTGRLWWYASTIRLPFGFSGRIRLPFGR